MASEPATPMKVQAEVPFRSGHQHAVVVMLLYGATVCLIPVSIFLSLRLLAQIAAIDGGEGAYAAIEQTESIQGGVGIVQLLLWIASIIAFMMWVHRSYYNLRAFGAKGLRYSPGWAVGYYFIPILNLFRPLQAMNDIWKASDPAYVDRGGLEWQRATLTPLLGAWWGAELISRMMGQAVFRMSMRAESLEELLMLERLSIASDIADAIAVVLVLAVIYFIDRRQTEAHRRLFGGNDEPGFNFSDH